MKFIASLNWLVMAVLLSLPLFSPIAITNGAASVPAQPVVTHSSFVPDQKFSSGESTDGSIASLDSYESSLNGKAGSTLRKSFSQSNAQNERVKMLDESIKECENRAKVLLRAKSEKKRRDSLRRGVLMKEIAKAEVVEGTRSLI